MNLRSKWLKTGGAVVAVLSLVGLSFGAHAAVPAKHTAAKPKLTGTAIFSDYEFPDNLNPVQGNIVVDGLVENFTWDGLYGYNNKAKLYPDMASKVPTFKNGGITNGGKTITVHLKKGMKFSDGQTITSKDVAFSWKVAMNKVTGPWCTGSCDSISSISTPNSTTDVFHFKHVNATALVYAIRGFPIIPSKFHSSVGSWSSVKGAANVFYTDKNFNYESKAFPTSGAYQVTGWAVNDRITLSPFMGYHTMKNAPRLKHVLFLVFTTVDDMIAGAANKSTDVTQDYKAGNITTLQSHKQFKTLVEPGFEIEHFELNSDATYKGAPNPLHLTKVRQALALALQKTNLIASANSMSTKAAKSIEAQSPWTVVPSKHFFQPFSNKKITGAWDPIAKKYVQPGSAQAVKDAKKLLSQTRYKSGFHLDAVTTTGNTIRQTELAVAQKSWQPLGVTMTPNYIPASTLFATDWSANGTLDHGAFQVADFAFLGSPDPDQWKYDMMSNKCDRKASPHNGIVNGNYSCFANKTIDKDFTKAAKTLNNKLRNKYYQQIQAIFSHNAYWIPLYYPPEIATTDGKVKNLTNNPTQAGVTWNGAQWRTTKR